MTRLRAPDRLSTLDALVGLDALCGAVQDQYIGSLREGPFERWEERS